MYSYDALTALPDRGCVPIIVAGSTFLFCIPRVRLDDVNTHTEQLQRAEQQPDLRCFRRVIRISGLDYSMSKIRINKSDNKENMASYVKSIWRIFA